MAFLPLAPSPSCGNIQEFPALGTGMANLNLGGTDEGYSRQVREAVGRDSCVCKRKCPLARCVREREGVCLRWLLLVFAPEGGERSGLVCRTATCVQVSIDCCASSLNFLGRRLRDARLYSLSLVPHLYPCLPEEQEGIPRMNPPQVGLLELPWVCCAANKAFFLRRYLGNPTISL